MATATHPTRYERVREILDRTAGDSAADYGGIGRFWDLPLPRLLEVEVHGIRMIALAQEATVASCCAGHHAAQSPAGNPVAVREPPYPGRGATSGLIRGLRGQAPFDGSHFPRLPWGGSAVPEEEVRFISDWIDDG